MPQPAQVQAPPLAEVLAAFSYALDVTEGQPAGHCIRSCWIGTHIGQAVGLAGAELSDLYYTLLLKDLGCSSNAARMSQLYLAHDHAFKREFKKLDSGVGPALAFVFQHAGRDADPFQRFKAIANILANGPQIVNELIAARCTRGAAIARRLRFSEAVAAGVHSLDEHWDGGGHPDHLAGEAIPLNARIALLAQVIDVFHAEGGPDAALAEARARAGRWFDPALVRAFEGVARDPAFWTKLASADLERWIFTLPPALAPAPVDEDYLDDIAAAFGEVVDAKSPYTSGHSMRVAHYAVAVAQELGVDPASLRWLRRAALLHDVGKLAVSSAILDKPGRLGEDEWVQMRDHAVQSEAILSRISAFGAMAFIAGAHHERLDGKGYPRGLKAKAIPIETRIITVADFFDALSADRPYRAAMPVEKALTVIASETGSAVDPACYEALRAVVRRDGVQPGAKLNLDGLRAAG
jgi:putative nucleotidyltransferase with HDIG domain